MPEVMPARFLLLAPLIESLVAERKVRAVAEVGPADLPAWAGTQPSLLTFERGLDTAQTGTVQIGAVQMGSVQTQMRSGVSILRQPYDSLERWLDWDTLRTEPGALRRLALCRAVYDPTGHLGRISRTLAALSAGQLEEHRHQLLNQAEYRLGAAQALLGPGGSLAAQLLVLADVRQLATELLYPALLTHLHLWPGQPGDLRLPHLWRAQLGLRCPKAVYRLDALQGFGGEAQARQVLLASRGLNLTEQEKRARLAVQHGYYDGAVLQLRSEAARIWRADIERWTYLTSARRDKLGTLLGASVSPLGPVAVELARELVEDVRVGR
ncbi:hypothetical protein [Deinococcus sp.]|uniref:hypothetical protein n=1 Tax=Deinococcus sp. TaxID=47478 RepID=UPI0025F37C37|nr:hypothetical protein [Deinococcus sp.]